MWQTYLYTVLIVCLFSACKKSDSSNTNQPPTQPATFNFSGVSVNGKSTGLTYTGVNVLPVLKFNFSSPIDHASVNTNFTLKNVSGTSIPFTATYENNDKTVILQPSSQLGFLSRYTFSVSTNLRSKTDQLLNSPVSVQLSTGIDSTNKFPLLSDDALLNLVEQQTFKYFWDFGHPVSGLARERNSSPETVTSGGSGFGIMAIVTGISRNFITRAEGLARMQKIVGFLKTAQTFHGAFPHWLDGTTGQVIPFSSKDNGADIVETSYLMEGLLTARQFFNGGDGAETALRTDINILWNAVDWNWFRQNDQNVLYWHWSPSYNWELNFQLKGWNEALITYVLAASSPAHSIPKIVYDNGWASNGGMKNGSTYYSYTLPLGPAYGGPLFFEHYSFMGINPGDLNDTYANYHTQTVNHTKINYEYCKENPLHWYGYSNESWGLTASDVPDGYNASSPTNDVGVIAPTAALSSFPYTPVESMQALKFFYYKLGDKLWGPYGFKDAYSLDKLWFADSYLAIDEGPIIVMIENYRSGLLWQLFTSCPEVKTGMKNLGFTAGYL
jgi:hypothetical protein